MVHKCEERKRNREAGSRYIYTASGSGGATRWASRTSLSNGARNVTFLTREVEELAFSSPKDRAWGDNVKKGWNILSPQGPSEQLTCFAALQNGLFLFEQMGLISLQ
jgi:hypothetical protein